MFCFVVWTKSVAILCRPQREHTFGDYMNHWDGVANLWTDISQIAPQQVRRKYIPFGVLSLLFLFIIIFESSWCRKWTNPLFVVFAGLTGEVLMLDFPIWAVHGPWRLSRRVVKQTTEPYACKLHTLNGMHSWSVVWQRVSVFHFQPQVSFFVKCSTFGENYIFAVRRSLKTNPTPYARYLPEYISFPTDTNKNRWRYFHSS